MLKSLAPILIAKDLNETVNFYTEKLGFQLDFIYNEPGIDGYASIYRDNVIIHFREGQPPSNPSSFGGISIEVDDVDALFQELKQKPEALPVGYPRDFSHIREHGPEDKEYGVRDMFLVDLNGYIITILSPIS